MKYFLASFLTILCLYTTLNAQKINLLYDTQNDGSIYPNSVWIVNMIKEAGKAHNIEVHFEGAPWSRALELIKSGVADGLINASYKQERAKFAVYPMKGGKPDVSKSLKAPAYYLYKRADHPLEFNGKELIHANGEIAAIQSYAVVDNLKALNAKITYGNNTASNLNSVLYKQVIAAAELESEAINIIKDKPLMQQNIVKLPIPVRQKEYYLIISKPYYKKNKVIAEKLWQGIEKLRETPKYIKARNSSN